LEDQLALIADLPKGLNLISAIILEIEAAPPFMGPKPKNFISKIWPGDMALVG
jgi:hypothetical protein